MNKTFLLNPIFIISLFLSCKAQSPALQQYTDMLIKGNRLFGLTDKGGIHVLNLDNDSYIDTSIHASEKISSFALDYNGDIVVEAGKKIQLMNDKEFTFKVISKSPASVYNIIFTKTNKSYVVTTGGIYDAQTKKTYRPDINFRLNTQVKGWAKPKAVFVDANDNIWLGYGFGEWGAELYIFSTQTKKFIKPVVDRKIQLEPIKSIFSDGKTVYISGSLQHMLTYSSIIKFNDFKCDSLFSSSDHGIATPDKPGITRMGGGEYIGPALFNKKDSCIYFYSENGIFKGDISKDLSSINKWIKIAQPKLHWKNGQADAVGSTINVLKMQFAENGKLYLLTQNDGIGVWDSKGFRLLN